jgi:hypothetical protein
VSLTVYALIDTVNVGLHPVAAIGSRPTCTGSKLSYAELTMIHEQRDLASRARMAGHSPRLIGTAPGRNPSDNRSLW